jgi:hypothetical protein
MTFAAHESLANSLIFWSGSHLDVQPNHSEADSVGSRAETVAPVHDHRGDEVDSVSYGPAQHKRVSSYVDLFESMSCCI